tara:strand:+ start:60 stop:536 length:477 start_codon:yes stop_codon:yes gene_type:complete
VKEKKIMTDQAPRKTQTRETEKRRQPWRPPSSLDAPEAPEGFTHRWIRASIMGSSDDKNLSARLREGFELVRADEYPNFLAPTIEDGKHAGIIGVGGLVLARFPIEIKSERDAYFKRKRDDQIEAVENDFLRENNPIMPIQKPERQSRVTFGGQRPSE